MEILKEMADAVVTGDKEACAKLADKASKKTLIQWRRSRKALPKEWKLLGTTLNAEKFTSLK